MVNLFPCNLSAPWNQASSAALICSTEKIVHHISPTGQRLSARFYVEIEIDKSIEKTKKCICIPKLKPLMEYMYFVDPTEPILLTRMVQGDQEWFPRFMTISIFFTKAKLL